MKADRSDVVVVGVDGSAASVSALVAALREAGPRHLDVEVVTAWSWHDPSRRDLGFVLSRAARRRALRAQAAVVARAVRIVGDVPTISAVIVEGDPAEVLASASEGAHSLFLGVSHRQETGAGTGSVRERCLRAAGCPVLVTPQSEVGTLPAYDDGFDQLHTNLVDVPPRGVSHVGP